jgi:hypothetical protein
MAGEPSNTAQVSIHLASKLMSRKTKLDRRITA